MNLNHITLNPHAEGFIKVACETDPMLAERPRTSNEFVITARHHSAPPSADRPGGTLATHPLHDKLGVDDPAAGRKVVKEIPITIFHNSAARALRISYQAYSRQGNIPVCTGDGKTAQRLKTLEDGTSSVETPACPGPQRCAFAQSDATCHRQVRMPVQVEGQSNPLSVFEVRTSSLNTYRALRSQLLLIEKRFGGLRHVPLKLTLWQASNEASGYEPFNLMELTLNAPDLFAAQEVVTQLRAKYQAAGLCDEDVAGGSDDDEVEAGLGVPTLDFQGMGEIYTHSVTSTAPIRRHALTVPPATGAAALAISEAIRGARLQEGAHAVSGEGQQFMEVGP